MCASISASGVQQQPTFQCWDISRGWPASWARPPEASLGPAALASAKALGSCAFVARFSGRVVLETRRELFDFGGSTRALREIRQERNWQRQGRREGKGH